MVLLPRSPSASKTYFPIPVDHLEEEYRLRSADDGKLFREEYNSLPGGNAQGTYEEANKDENKEKNRYPNILPCECTLCSVGTRFSFDSHPERVSCLCAHVFMSLFFFFFQIQILPQQLIFIHNENPHPLEFPHPSSFLQFLSLISVSLIIITT